MTSLIGKLTGSAVAFTNENSLSLANLNLDFSLIKLEAPREFSRLALSISQKRKFEAEDGALHRTARRLGALFEGSLPTTKALFRAYGTRASEISSEPIVNPRSSEKENIFSSQIGLDTASIWAAATSGAGAIAVHLLACMLARIFTSSEATSVWVEIVERQKGRIIKERDGDLYIDRYDSLILAARQEIPRTDLANWDASARAWLQSADQAKARQHTQMRLILNNASLPVNGEPDTYNSVMKAWVTALSAMENLITGMPQQIQDGAALLAISSWHIYPDILLFGDTAVDIKQKDPLFEDTAVLTLGLEVTKNSDKTVSWSLPLARLQYYGDPVHTSRSAGPDNSRITSDQFSYIVLGCVFDTWASFGGNSETALAWLDNITSFVRQPLHNEMSFRRPQSHELLWLEHLDVAFQKLTRCNGIDKQLAWQLVSLGRRRSTFLYPPNRHPIPLFGLSHLSNLIPILKNDQTRIEQLRMFASRLGLSTKSYVIRYQPSESPFAFEYTTIRPKSRKSTIESGLTETSGRHVCWFPIGPAALEELCQEENPSFRRQSPIWKRYTELTRQGNLCFPVLETVVVGRTHPAPYLGYLTKVDFMTTAKSLLRRWFKNRPYDGGFHSILVAGTVEAAIFQIAPSQTRISGQLEPQDILESIFTSEKMNITKLLAYLLSRGQHELVPLKAYAAVSNIYALLSCATISTLVLAQPLWEAKWARKEVFDDPIPALSRQQAFACISMFETGTCNLDPQALGEVFAISSGNSLFISSSLLVDPYEQPHVTDIRRVVGNIGRAGLSLLVPPPRAKIRGINLENWKEINHLPFEGIAEDCFRNTSIHLSFTEYEMPLGTAENGNHTIDRPINLIESLVSVYDRGRWVADLDVLKAFFSNQSPGQGRPSIYRQFCNRIPITDEGQKSCEKSKVTFLEASKSFPQLRAISVDNWEELLDPPTTGAVVIRANKNWLARLALSVVCIKFGLRTIILGDEVCWSCCAKLMLKQETSEEISVPVKDTEYHPPIIYHGDSTDKDSDSDYNSENQEAVSGTIEARAEKDSDEKDSTDDDSEDGFEAADNVIKDEQNGENRKIALIY